MENVFKVNMDGPVVDIKLPFYLLNLLEVALLYLVCDFERVCRVLVIVAAFLAAHLHVGDNGGTLVVPGLVVLGPQRCHTHFYELI